jgi:hypothetical protein
MDPLVTAALISLVGSALIAIGAVIAAIIQVRKRREAERAGQEKAGTLKGAAAYTVERIEYSASFDETGSGVIERKWFGIKTTQNIQDLELPYTSRVDSPKATIDSWTAEELPGSVATAQFVRDDEASSSKVLIGKIIIAGFLKPTSGSVGYCMQQRNSFTYLMTREEVKEAYKNDGWHSEYVAYAVRVPGVKQLTLIVTFPPSHHGLTPRPTGVVLQQDKEAPEAEQTARFVDEVTFTGTTATLVIPEPKIGLRYGITWESPRKT